MLNKTKVLEAYSKHLESVDIADLAREYNVSWHSMYNAFKRRNLLTTKGLHKNLKYRNIKNENYFKEINSHTKAYFLGLLYADGWLRTKRNCIGIKLKKSDKNILDILREELKLITPLRQEANSWCLEFSSAIMKEDLIKLGLYESKTYKQLNLPKIDEQYLNSFILGYLDGDGWISISSRVQIGICSLSVIILESMNTYLEKNNINSVIYCDKRNQKNHKLQNLYTLCISNNQSRLRFLNLIYKDCPVHLDRKYQKFLQANTVLNDKINKLSSV